jgi:hypothetical protein
LRLGCSAAWLDENGTTRAVIASVVAAALFHIQPVFAVPWLVTFLLTMRRRTPIGAMALLIVPALPCLPWSRRNLREIGTPLIRDGLGLELYVSFNDCAQTSFQESLDHFCISKLHPNSDLGEALDLKRLGEKKYNQERFRDAVVGIIRHPGASTRLAGRRFWLFWFPVTGGFSGYLQPPRYLRGTYRNYSITEFILDLRFPLSEMARSGGLVLGRVIDKTGLTGHYDFSFEFAGFRGPGGDFPPPLPDGQSDTAPYLFDALRQQLGLSLEPKKAPLDVIVVEHVDRFPTEN